MAGRVDKGGLSEKKRRAENFPRGGLLPFVPERQFSEIYFSGTSEDAASAFDVAFGDEEL